MFWQVPENKPQADRTCQTTPQPNTILDYAWHLKKNGRKESTITTVSRRLTFLAKHADLNNPEQIKETLLKLKWQNATKHQATNDYTGFLTFIGKTWIKPHYIPQEKVFFIPTESEIDQLIAASGKTPAPLLQFLKETAARIGEATQVQWTDIDTNNKTVAINHPEKGSLPRLIPISDKLLIMLNTLPKTDKPIFLTRTTQHGIKNTFEAMRKRIAQKTNNPRLLKIHFHTLRHWKATTLMLKGVDSYYIRKLLGHKSSYMTDRYINIVTTLTTTNEEYEAKAVTTTEEAIKLIQTGYTKADEINGIHIYRKRK